MTPFTLITGFLGAGKTTFLKEFVRLFPGMRPAILVNEFGKEDVDGTLLRQMEADLAEVPGGSIFCACRAEQFADALTALMQKAPGVVITETSGLSDPTRIRALLMEHPLAAEIEYRGCLCLADACRFDKVLNGALAAAKQLAVSDVVVLNKTDAATPAQLERTRALLRERRPDAPVLETSFGRIPPGWEDTLRFPGLLEAESGRHTRDLSVVSRLLRLREPVSRERLLALLREIAPAAYRIKGFVRLEDGCWLAEAVGEDVALTPWRAAASHVGHLVVLSGNGLPLRAALAGVERRFGDILEAIE